MKRTFWIGIILLVLASPIGAAEKANVSGIKAAVDEALKFWQVPGVAVAVVQGNEVLYLEGHGVREIGKESAVTPDTVFAIASCTKAFTATAIAALVDEGKMSWDDPVRKHLVYFRLSDPLADREVTLRDLLCHRTGLSRHDLLGIGSPWPREDVLRRVAFLEPTKSFRSTYQYNNLMYLAAGEAAAATAKTSWEDAVRTRLLGPLGMQNVNFSTTVAEKLPDHARPHKMTKEGKVETIAWRNLDNIAPAGAMNTSARELTKWVRFQLGDGTWEGKRVVSAAALAETKMPQTVIRLEGAEKELNPESAQRAYGLGWIVQDYRGRHLVSHTGGLEGYRCRIALVPSEKLGLVVLTNSGAGTSGAALHIALSSTILDQLLGLPKKDWNSYLDTQAKKVKEADRKKEEERTKKRHAGTKPSRELTAYAGTYSDPAYGQATVTLEAGELKLAWSNFKGRLDHYHYDTFTIRAGDLIDDEQVVFSLGTDGDVASLRLLGVDFKKAKAMK